MERRQQETFGQKRWTQVSRMRGAWDRRKEDDTFWDIDHGNMHTQEESIEPIRKGVRFGTMGYTRLRGRTHKKQTMVARSSLIQKWTSRICTGGICDDNLRQDTRERGMSCYKEGRARKQYREKHNWRKDWTRWRTE